MDQILVDSVVKAMLILETAPLNTKFNEETLSFLQDLYLWRRPEKFLVNDEVCKFVSGKVGLWAGKDRCLQFKFDNGYVWFASISKLGTKALIRHCRQIVAEHLDSEVYAA